MRFLNPSLMACGCRLSRRNYFLWKPPWTDLAVLSFLNEDLEGQVQAGFGPLEFGDHRVVASPKVAFFVVLAELVLAFVFRWKVLGEDAVRGYAAARCDVPNVLFIHIDSLVVL